MLLTTAKKKKNQKTPNWNQSKCPSMSIVNQVRKLVKYHTAITNGGQAKGV
jgi:hypothetical protein